MPDGGPEVVYEWARTASNEVVCRITRSAAADLILQGYMPWTSDPPKHSVLYAEGPRQRFLRGRSWVPHTRDGMRWSLALSNSPEEVMGDGSGVWYGYIPQAKTLYLAGRQGQRYEEIEAATGPWLENGRGDEVLERNRERYLEQRPAGRGWLADTHRVAISDHRLLAFDGERVTFRWKDYTHGNKQRRMTVTAGEFLRRFVQHVLPRGFVRIRYSGFLASHSRAALLALARQLLAVTPKPHEPCAPPSSEPQSWLCPRCGTTMRIGQQLTAAQLAFRCSFFDSS